MNSKKKKMLKRAIPLYIMVAPGFIYLLINNYIPMLGIVIAFKNLNFSKGILKSDKAISSVLPKGELVYPLSQHIGAPAVPVVEKGEHVLVGQKIVPKDLTEYQLEFGPYGLDYLYVEIQ